MYQNLYDRAKKIVKKDACLKFYDASRSPYLETDASVLCMAIAVLVSFYYKFRGLYALTIYFAYSPRFSCSSSGLLVFTHLGGLYLLAHQ